jgi:hypothetical protein
MKLGATLLGTLQCTLSSASNNSRVLTRSPKSGDVFVVLTLIDVPMLKVLWTEMILLLHQKWQMSLASLLKFPEPVI